MSCFSFLFLGVVRHYDKSLFSCLCKACSRVRGRGLGSQSSGPDLLVTDCTCAKQTAWAEDQFTVTSSPGIRNREKRIADIVVRELKGAKPGAWGCVQAHEVWSTEEEANRWSGHFWISKLGTVPGSMSCVEKKFELQGRKWEEYKGTRYSDGDSTLVVELWLYHIGLLMICQDSRFRSGTPQRVLTTQVLRWKCSSTRASCAPRTSPSRK
jgi:hypothetical protein